MCDFPINIKNPKAHQPGELQRILVPCGKCHSCYTKRSNQWYIRLFYELKSSTSAYFITLTYDACPLSENLHRTLKKKDLQDFFMRLRKHDNTKGIKYYAVGEYGSHTHRPHYHIILFNLKSIDSVKKAWTLNQEFLGNIHVGDVTDQSIKYVTGYIGKKIGIPQSDDDDRQPEFSLMSKSMGLHYVDYSAYRDVQAENGYITLNGIKYAMPRYYKNLIYPEYKRKIISKKNYAFFIKGEESKAQNFHSNQDFDNNKRSIAQIRSKSPKYSKL